MHLDERSHVALESPARGGNPLPRCFRSLQEAVSLEKNGKTRRGKVRGRETARERLSGREEGRQRTGFPRGKKSKRRSGIVYMGSKGG